MNDVSPERTRAIVDVLNERFRQVHEEGWTPEHDDTHADGEMARAAAAYALFAGQPHRFSELAKSIRSALAWLWPWSAEWWKPSTSDRRNLVKAGALILAELERLDRAAEGGETIIPQQRDHTAVGEGQSDQ